MATQPSFFDSPFFNRFMPRVGHGAPPTPTGGSALNPLDYLEAGAGEIPGVIGDAAGPAFRWLGNQLTAGAFENEEAPRAPGLSARPASPLVRGNYTEINPVPPIEPELGGNLEPTRPAGYVPPSPPTRAVRMPDGRLVFTNQDDVGGSEVPMAEATSSFRNSPGPVGATMTALIRSAARANEPRGYSEDQPKSQYITGRPTGIAANMSGSASGGGGVSTMSGTPIQQLEIAQGLADAEGALAATRQATKVANMEPGEAALLGNPQVQAMGAILSHFQPKIAQLEAEAEAEAAQVVRVTSDPRMREAALNNVAAKRDAEIMRLQNLMSVLMGIRPAQTYP